MSILKTATLTASAAALALALGACDTMMGGGASNPGTSGTVSSTPGPGPH